MIFYPPVFHVSTGAVYLHASDDITFVGDSVWSHNSVAGEGGEVICSSCNGRLSFSLCVIFLLGGASFTGGLPVLAAQSCVRK